MLTDTSIFQHQLRCEFGNSFPEPIGALEANGTQQRWRDRCHQGQQGERQMLKGELPLSRLQGAAEGGHERFDLECVIDVIAFDPEMAAGLEFKIEVTQ